MVRPAVVGRTVEVPPQFIALCETIGVSPQAALRGMAAMVCSLRYATTTAWCRWKAKPREVCPGAVHACFACPMIAHGPNDIRLPTPIISCEIHRTAMVGRNAHPTSCESLIDTCS
jgi:hypothetical protein